MSIIRPPPLPTPSTTVIEERILPAHLGLAKHHLIKWRFVGGVFATMLVVGWIFIIVILIQEEKWQLVLVAWLVLYAAAHFCYWYFKRHHLLSIHSVICRRARGNVGEVGGFSVAPSLKNSDAPPSYDDIVKSEAPPPEYYSVVVETPKVTNSKKSPFTFPKVFGRNSAPSTPCPTRGPTSTKPIFYLGSRKLPSSVENANIGSSEEPSRKRSNPPPYLELDRTSFVATSSSSPPPPRLPVVTSEPILSSILNNITVVSVELHEQPQLTTSTSETPSSRPSEQFRKSSSDSNH